MKRWTPWILSSLAALAHPAAAQFADTEVSAPGQPPFLLSKSGGTFESVTGAGITYNIYRRQPADDFRCLEQDLATNAWAGDAASPVNACWWYVVNAYDGTDENRHGNGLPIVQSCKPPAPIRVTKTPSPATVAPGAQATFTIVIDNSAGSADLTGCVLSDDVGATGCMTLTSCEAPTPPIASLTCDTGASRLDASGFDVPRGTTQTIPITVTAGLVETSCTNTVNVTCGVRTGMATGAVDIAVVPAQIDVRLTPGAPSRQVGRDVTFTIEVENTSAVTARNVTVSDRLTATGCMILKSCDSSVPPLGASLTCNAPTDLVASGFDIPAGTTQTITVTATAGALALAACANQVDVTGDNFLPGSATASVAITGCAPPTGTPAVTLSTVATGLSSPVYLTSPPGDSTRQFVVEQVGRVRIIQGTLIVQPFLDITALVLSGGERGLLSIAFHPDYASNGKFYVYYNRRPDGAIRIAEYVRSAGNPNLADSTSARAVLLCRHDSAGNHNGGQLGFSPRDGYLYIGTGDGGGGGDPDRNGQNLAACLGKILRIDVDGTAPPLEYRIPPDNPFVGDPLAAPEIWAYGLRNPWRFSFDRTTADLYIGDVGQGAWEEVNVQPAASTGGENYGWNVVEGYRHCYQPATGCNLTGKTSPVAEYSHGCGGCSITGGVVYRGAATSIPQGTYFYSDYCSNRTWSFEYVDGMAARPKEWTSVFGALSSISSYGEDADGEIYILELGGTVHNRPVTGTSSSEAELEALEPPHAAADRPGWGAALAILLLLTVCTTSLPRRVAAQRAYLLDFATSYARLSPRTPPEVLLIGDSRMGEVVYAEFARAFAAGATPPRGSVWSAVAASIPDMLAQLRAGGFAPPVVVVGASPLSMALARFTRRQRSEADLPWLTRKRLAIGRRLREPFEFLPAHGGPAAVVSLLTARWPALRAAGERYAHGDQPPTQTAIYRGYYAAEPPAMDIVSATIAGLRALARGGSRVVVVRLPVDREMRLLEDGWGAARVLPGIARAAAAPFIDVQALAVYPELESAILDGSHVEGEAPRRRLSEELGREVRRALARPVDPR